MKGFNGSFSYTPEYSCTKEDYKAAKEIYGSEGISVPDVSAVADLQLENGRGVLMQVERRKVMSSLDPVMCVIFIQPSGTKYYVHAGNEEVPKTHEEFANSFLEIEAGNDLVQKRANLWSLVHRASNMGEEIADHVIRSSMVEVTSEEEHPDGSLELEIEYDERLERAAALHYGEKSADKEMVKQFVTDSLKDKLN